MTQHPPSPRHRWRTSSIALDVVIALSFFTMLTLGVIAYGPLLPGEELPPTSVAIGLGVALTAPLAFRRRAPRLVLLIVTVAFTVFRLLEFPEWSVSSLALFVALYTTGAQLPPQQSRWPRVASLTALVLLIVYTYAVMFDPATIEITGRELFLVQIAEVAFNILFAVAAWMLGDIAWRRRRAEAELADQLEELTASREALARQAVQQERVRIARELHDVVAHHVSVMGIQAGAARRSLDRDPQRVGDALASVEQASRDAVKEMQRLLCFLRSDGDEGNEPMSPQPSLRELDGLIEQVRDTGLEVQVTIDGDPRPLAGSVELSAFRIVQEALTNTLKHGEGVTRAEVALRYDTDRLHLQVRDDGTAASRTEPDASGGRGLLGMRERASLHGGELQLGARPGGGFAVEGWLPANHSPESARTPA